VRDPELSYTTKGTAVCKFSVACNRFLKQDDETQKEVSCFDISWWTDADGKPRSRIEIVPSTWSSSRS
jgi:hypothetical protein